MGSSTTRRRCNYHPCSWRRTSTSPKKHSIDASSTRSRSRRSRTSRSNLGAGINSKPCPDHLILGADSLLLDNADFVVTQPKLTKPFDFDPFAMRTKYRFIEGYAGNDTVRGWRSYDSIYHAVLPVCAARTATPRGVPYEMVPQGLLLRPAIPSDEIFGVDSTYGPRANFKIALRELPDHGRFRVTVRPPNTTTGCCSTRAQLRNPATGPMLSSGATRRNRNLSRSSKPGSIRWMLTLQTRRRHRNSC